VYFTVQAAFVRIKLVMMISDSNDDDGETPNAARGNVSTALS